MASQELEVAREESGATAAECAELSSRIEAVESAYANARERERTATRNAEELGMIHRSEALEIVALKGELATTLEKALRAEEERDSIQETLRIASSLLVAGDPKSAYETMRAANEAIEPAPKDIQFDQARLLELLLVANEEYAKAEERCDEALRNEKKAKAEEAKIRMDRGAAEVIALALDALTLTLTLIGRGDCLSIRGGGRSGARENVGCIRSLGEREYQASTRKHKAQHGSAARATEF